MFFGANNYQAGLIAGRALGEYAREQWKGKIDKVLLLEQPIAGAVPQARLTGAVNGIQEIIGPVPETAVIHLDGSNEQESRRETLKFLNTLASGEKILIATIHDPAALGAGRAIKEAGRNHKTVVVVGQNATQEARKELAN